MNLTPAEKQAINIKCAELLGYTLGEYQSNIYSYLHVLHGELNNEIPYNHNKWVMFDIFQSAADRADVIEKLRITVQFRPAKIMEDWSCSEPSGDLFADKSRTEAILKCICEVVNA